MSKLEKYRGRIPDFNQKNYHRLIAVFEVMGTWKYFDGSHGQEMNSTALDRHGNVITNDDGEVLRRSEVLTSEKVLKIQTEIAEAKAILKLVVEARLVKTIDGCVSPCDMIQVIKDEYEPGTFFNQVFLLKELILKQFPEDASTGQLRNFISDKSKFKRLGLGAWCEKMCSSSDVTCRIATFLAQCCEGHFLQGHYRPKRT